MAARWTASVGGAYTRNDPLHTLSASAPLRSFQGTAGIEYRLTDNLGMSVLYGRQQQRYEYALLPSATANQNRVWFSLSYAFVRPSGKVMMPEVLDDPSLEKTDWRKHWRVLCRRRWWLALPAFGIWIAVWAVAWFLPAVYRSETVILLEQQKVPEQYVVPNVSADLQDQLQNMTQQILGRTRLLEVIKTFNLYPGLRARVTDDEMVERMRKDIQVELVQATNRSGNLSAFKVAYLSNNPALAQKVTAQLTSLFINENLKTREKQSSETTQFLGEQVEDAGRRLAEQEAKVKEFKTQYLGQLPEQVQSNVQILSGLQAQLQQETDHLGRATQQSVYLDTLRTQWRTLEASAGPGNSSWDGSATRARSGTGPAASGTGRLLVLTTPIAIRMFGRSKNKLQRRKR